MLNTYSYENNIIINHHNGSGIRRYEFIIID